MPPHAKRKRSEDDTRGAGQHKGARPNPNTGHHSTPRHSIGPPYKRDGAPTLTRGDTNTQTGGTASQPPPFTYHATPRRHATPPSTTAPPTTTTRGEHTQDTPPHEHHRQTHATTHHSTWRGRLCDMTALLTHTPRR
nr:MAG TPA: hypothetical protein [Caudoviricetes sp.]